MLTSALPLVLALVPGTCLLGQEETLLAARDQALVQDLRPRLGLTADDTVKVAKVVPDPLMEGHDARLAQYHRGVKVMGGEGILHLSGPRQRGLTDAFVRGLDLETTPVVPPGEALAVALRAVGLEEAAAEPPTTELVVVRLKEGDALAYRIHLESGRGARTTRQDVLVDAQNGALLRHWSTLYTGRAAKSVGHSQYSGKVTLDTTWLEKEKRFELRDWTRGKTGNVTVNCDLGSDDGGKPFTKASGTWGDGRNYAGGKTTTCNGETAAVDAAFGLQSTWDYYNRVHGRKGIDGHGSAVTMRVHFASDYDNAFWDDGCFCVTIGDGSMFKSLDALDVIGHELSHGVCSATANLEYWGESGSLNEANSDIHGTMVEFYTRGGAGSSIADFGGNWTVGEDIEKQQGVALRYLYKPSKDGESPDAWSEDLQFLDVHNGSGPMNRAFFFLSQGASAKKTSDFYTDFLPKGMQGVGNDRAARIWFRAMVHYLTSQSGYPDARKAAIASAQDLYGTGSQEEQAVWNAFHGINVGPVWK